MRGVPNNPVRCVRCSRMKGCATDGLCHSCRMLRRSPTGRKFIWTPELDETLQRVYKTALTRAELTANITHLQRRTGFTRNAILSRAVQLGLSFSTRRAWSAEDLRTLQELAGRTTLKALAAKLNRTHASVKGKVKGLGLSVRLSEGYSREDLRQLLGVSARSVQTWLAAGWLRPVRGRIPETGVLKFLRLHSEQYHLGRVDQAWFKGLLFPAFNSATQRPAARPARRVETVAADFRPALKAEEMQAYSK